MYIIVLTYNLNYRQERAGPFTGCYFYSLTGKWPAVLLNRLVIHMIVN